MRSFLFALFALFLTTQAVAAPSFQIADSVVVEGQRAIVTIAKSGANGQSSKISFSTVDGSARSGVDYTRRFGSLVFKNTANVTTLSIPTTLRSGTQSTRVFYVRIRSLTNATISDDTATVTIHDTSYVPPTEPPPTPPATQTCWNGQVIPATDTCPVDPGPPPPTTKVCWDGSIIPIANSCPPYATFTIGDVTVSEEAGTAVVTVTKTSANAHGSDISFTTVNGTAIAGQDFNGVAGMVSFGPSQLQAQISVPIVNDAIPEPNKTFTVQLTPGNNSTLTRSSATVTITDPDVVAPPPSSFVPTPINPGSVTNPPTTDFNIADALIAAPIPGTAKPDVLGAFRFICKADAVSFPWMLDYVDPVVYPGDPGKSHLHQFYGNTTPNIGMANYALLRSEGGSTCNQVGDQKSKALNRSGYWQAALIETATNSVIQPDFISIYYKRRPSTDPVVSAAPGTPVTDTLGRSTYAQGFATNLPPGLRFVFGFDPTNPNAAKTGFGYFNCQGPTSTPGKYPDLTNVATWCPKGAGNQLGWVIEAPDCWNGTALDSANHRDHVAYGYYDPNTGAFTCPPTHPKVIATFTLGSWYSVEAGDSPETWDFSCASMAPGKPRGFCGHADWFGAWDPTAQADWEIDGCVNKLLNCSAGVLGQGQQLVGAAVGIYNGVAAQKNPRHKVPVPPAPGTMPPMPMAKNLTTEGDSISVTWSGNYTGLYGASRPDVKLVGRAVGGSGIAQLIARKTAVFGDNPKVVTVLIGANDLGGATDGTTYINSQVLPYTDGFRAANIKVAIGTILPRCGLTLFNSQRAAANTAIRAAKAAGRIEEVIDFAADATMGPDAAACNTALYVDGTHPTDPTGPYGSNSGQSKLYAIFKPKVDALIDAP